MFKLFGKVGCIPEPPEAIVRTCKDFNATWAFPNGSGGNGKTLWFILALLVAVEAVVVLSIRQLWRAGNDGSMQFADMSKLAIVAIPTRSISKVSAGFQTGARIIAFADWSSAGASTCAPTLYVVVVVVVVEAPTLAVVKATTTLVDTVAVIIGVVDVTASTSASSTTTTASASSKCIILEIVCWMGFVSLCESDEYWYPLIDYLYVP